MSHSKYLLVKGYAGLGNRIAALVTAILYAQLNNRTLTVDWSDTFYSTTGENAFPKLFKLNNLKSTSEILTHSSSIFPKIWTHQLNKSIDILIDRESDAVKQGGQRVFAKYAANLHRLNYNEEVIVYSSYVEQLSILRRHFKGKFKHLKRLSNEQIFKQVFKDNLEFSDVVHELIQDFESKYFQGKQVIGLHIRHSDKAISLARYEKALKEQLEKTPDATIFLATDNRLVEQTYQAKYPNIVVTSKWLPEPGQKAHGNDSCPDLLIHAVESLVDLSLLARCDYLIYSRTTSFAQTARIISTTLSAERCFDIQTYEDQRNKSVEERIQKFWKTIQNKHKHLIAKLQVMQNS